MCTHPCWETVPLPTDPLLGHRTDPVLFFRHLSQPASNRGHPPMETKSPLVPSMHVDSRHTPQPPALHICTHAPAHVRRAYDNTRALSTRSGSAAAPHLSGASPASPALPPPRRGPCVPLTASLAPRAGQPCSGRGAGWRAGGPEEGEGVGAGL